MEVIELVASGLARDNMANGILTLTRNDSGVYLDGQIEWEAESNGAQANTSTVTATLKLKRSARNTTTGTFKGTFTVGSTSRTISWKGSLPSQTWVTVETITATVGHTSSGEGSCYLYAKINGPTETTMEGTFVSGSSKVALDKINRFATILSATDFTDEENPIITYSNPHGNNMHTLEACISVTGQSADVPYRSIGKTSSSYTFNLTDTERETLRKATEASNTIALKFVVRSRITADGESDTDNVKATMTVVNANPVVEFSVRDINEETVGLTGDESHLIAHYSTAEVSISAEPQKYATIPKNGIKITDGTTSWYKGANFTGVISPISSGNITFAVTDSRGNRSGGGGTNTFVDYFNPEIQISNVDRDTNGNLTFTVIGRAFKGSFGKVNNDVGVYYRYRESDGGTLTAWAAFLNSEITWNGNEFTAEKTISGLDYSKNYNVHVSITDVFHAGDKRIIVREEQLPTLPVFDWGADSFNFHVPVYDLTGAQIGNSESVWQNPPMQPAVEYRTLELYQGMPVYVKMLALGQLPASGQKTTAHNIQNISQMVAFEAFARARGTTDNPTQSNFQQFPFINSQGAVVAKAQATGSNAIIQVFSDLSTYDGFIKLKYTKTS